MEQSITKSCIYGSIKPCVAACPLNFSIAPFLEKAAAGNLNGAYRELANELLFPAIATELCRGDCRSACAADIDVLRIERECVRRATRKKPRDYNIPAQSGSVAVIGAGISGLACAYRLASRRFAVTLFFREQQLGGSLTRALPRELVQSELDTQFRYCLPALQRTSVSSLAELSAFDAVYIATGAGGDDFGLASTRNGQSLATARLGVFLGGELTGVDKLSALAHGKVAAASIEKYLKTGSMAGEAATFIKTASRIAPARVPATSGGGEFEVCAEAKRCAACDCTLCAEACDLLRFYSAPPREAESCAWGAWHPSKYTQKKGARMVLSCEQCGACAEACPESIDFGALFLESRKQMFAANMISPALHDYFLRDLETALTTDFLALGKGAPYMLFPGCAEAQSGSGHTEAALAYLSERCGGVSLLLGCCGVPALWAGDEARFRAALAQLREAWRELGRPVAVLLCAACLRSFAAYLPEIPCVSLYELIAKRGAPASAISRNEPCAVFDPCAARDFPALRAAVRRLARQTGGYAEPETAGGGVRCCGMGGHIYPSNKRLAAATLSRSAALSPLPYITYCANCRNLFLNAGKPARHILDDVFGLPPLARSPHISELRENRRLLKMKLENVRVTPTNAEGRIRIPENVLAKADAQLISAGEIRAVVEACERTSQKLRDRDGNIIGYRRLGLATIWVEYRGEGDALIVRNVYSHKSEIIARHE